MLGIHRSSSPEMASQYLVSGLSHEGEYFMDNKIDAYWSGKVAERLGIDGKRLTKKDFDQIVRGGYQNLKLRVRQVDGARSGYDFTFSAPKSVSMAHSITKNADILKAHRQAYQATLGEIQKDVQTQNNSQHERGWENTGELIVAPFDHFLSRPCEVKKDGKTIYVADPQLHTHCYIPNVTYSHEKQRFQAIELGNIHRQAKYFESVYHAYLATNLENLGFQVKRTPDRFELVGVNRNQIEKFSNRSHEINKAALHQKITNKAEKAKLSVTTRHSKAKGLKEEEQYQHWVDRLTQDELDKLHNLKDQPYEKQEKIDAKTAVQRSLNHHSERSSAFKERDVLAYSLKLGLGSSLLPKDVQKALNERSDIVRAELETIPYIATHQTIKEEQTLVMNAVEGKGKFRAINKTYEPKQSFLNDQQRNAIKEILASKDLVIALKGAAGTGKSTIISELNNAHLEVGKTIIPIAPSSHAAKVLRDKGHTNADTIAGFLKNQEHDNLFGQTILCDEAGMVGTKTMKQLVLLAKEKQARLILSGDTSQHAPPAQYGDSMSHLMGKAKIKTVSVNKVVRQSDQAYRNAVESLAKDRTLEGYKKLDKMGVVKEEPDREIRLNEIADTYINSIKAKKSALVVAPTHAENNEINSVIREKLKAQKMISGKEREVMSLSNLSFTDDQKKDPVNYQPGQVLRFTNNVKGNYRAGTHYEVIEGSKSGDLKIKNMKSGEIHNLPIEHHQAIQVFSQSKLALSKGDRIRLTANTKSIENSKALNGTSYQVTGFTKSGDIKLDNKKTLRKDVGHIRYAMCDTSHGSQGKDADNVIVSVSDLSFTTASREQFYVSVSRGKHNATVFTSDKTELKKAISKTEKRISAQDIADANSQRILQRNQRNHHRSLNEKIREHEQRKNRDRSATKSISPSKTRSRE